ncbi:NADAR family protein [Micromonospora sp. NPDC005652]|uniref:NADAR family protein n=1 Tax=Micromonospora sp. NPDC005652 TaxID=3157046 RepID=UPI00340B47FC
MTRPSTLAVINNFRGRWAFLSNFHRAPLWWEGLNFPTSEHAFNAGKTLIREERVWVRDAPKALVAKQRGRKVTLRPEWDEQVRYEVMASVLRAKFTAHPGRIDALLSTGDAELIEGTTGWCDTTWGRCFCPRHMGAGENHLGRLLMELRAELKEARGS